MVGFTKKLAMYKNQNFVELKKQQQSLGTLFVDATFPSIDAVLGTSRIPSNVQWKRPSDLCDNPRLFADLDSPNIIRAGEFSCNWVVSAFSILAGVNELRNKIIPNYWDQEWGGKEPYCGIFHFRIWRFGQWYDVVIDDLLPTVDNVLLITQTGAKNEFWISLVEKAYAKLHGSYEALREGELSDALVDFTGGICETIDIRAGQYSEIEENRSQLFDIIRKEINDHSLICFTINAPTIESIGDRTELGLRKGHAYHVTDIKKVHLGETTLRTLFNGREKVAMFRLRDPREEDIRPSSPDSVISSGEGNPFLYSTDALSRLRSRNTDWQQVKDNEFKRLGLSFRDSTEFWMPLEDAVSEFSDVTICRLVSENIFIVPGHKWRGSSIKGRWQTGPNNSQLDRSGGGDVHSESFLKNPQYMIDINSEMELMIQLLQFLDLSGLDSPNSNINLLIGFHVIKVENNRNTRLHKLWPHCTVVIVEGHKRKREIIYRGTLYGGRYILVPTCFRQGDHSSFLLRIFSQVALLNIRELKEDVPKSRLPCSCILPEIEWVTVITVEGGVIEHKSNTWGSSKLNLYCALTCEGCTVKTDISREDSNPVWNCSFIFYRKKTDKPILIKVFNKNTLFPDELIGECEIPAAITRGPTPLDVNLLPKSKTNDTETSSIGTINLSILTEDNLMAV